ncbi:MAG: hypothetical protein WBA57_04520 [Elainellaceae cyanobacterium]
MADFKEASIAASIVSGGDRHELPTPVLELTTCFVTLTLPILEHPGQLRDRVETALRAHGQPLRWAITQVEPPSESSPAIAHVEAIVTQS